MVLSRRIGALFGLAVSIIAVLWAASFPCADLQATTWCKAPLAVRDVVLQLLERIEEGN